MTNLHPPQPERAPEKQSTRHSYYEHLRQVGQLLLRNIEMPLRFVFGRDLFISYSRVDARKYAPNLTLALQKRMPKLSVYLDRWVAPPTNKLPLSLRMHLRWSSILVVVCTQNAIDSDFVKDEVRRFARLGRKVITVDVDGRYDSVRGQAPWVHVGGADPEPESPEAVKSGKPSDNVVERIVKSVEFTMQDRRLRRAAWGTLAFVVLSVGGTLLYSIKTIRAADARAAEADNKAAAANKRAEDSDKKAVAAEGQAYNAQQLEADAKQQAENARRAANAASAVAEAQRRVAAEQAKKAQREGTRASSRERLAEAEEIRFRGDERFLKPVSLALDAYKIFPSSEPESLFRYGLQHLPRLVSRIHDSASQIAFSRDGKNLLAWELTTPTRLKVFDVRTGKENAHLDLSGAGNLLLSRYGRYVALFANDKPNIVQILSVPDGQVVSVVQHGEPGVVSAQFSENEKNFAMVDGYEIRVWKVGDRSPRKVPHPGRQVLYYSISHDGRIVASISKPDDEIGEKGFVLKIWDVESGEDVLPPQNVPDCNTRWDDLGSVPCFSKPIFSVDSRYVAYYNTHNVFVFDLQQKQALKPQYLPDETYRIDINSAGATYQIAVIQAGGVARVFDGNGRMIPGYDLRLCGGGSYAQNAFAHDIAFAPGSRSDAPTLLATCNDKKTYLWRGDPVRGPMLVSMQNSSQLETFASHWAPNDTLLIAAEDKGFDNNPREIRVWQESRDEAMPLSQYGPRADTRGLLFSRDRRFSVAPTENKDVMEVFDTASGHKIGTVNVGSVWGAKGWGADFSDDGLYLYGGTFWPKLWDIKSGKEIAPAELKDLPAIPGMRLLAFNGDDNRFRVWRTGAGRSDPLLLPPGIRKVVISPDGERFLTWDEASRRIQIWKTSNVTTSDASLHAEPLAMPGPETSERVLDVSYSPKGHYLVTLSELPTDPFPAPRKWSLRLRSRDGTLLSSFTIGSDWPRANFSSDESRLLFVKDDFEVVVVNTSNGKVVRSWQTRSLDGCCVNLAMNADGKYVAMGYLDVASVWNVQTGERLSKFTYLDDEIVRNIAFSPDGGHLLVATDKQVERVLWKITDLEQAARARLLP